MITSKLCDRCKQELPVSAFYRKSTSKDGYQHYCKECINRDRKEGRKSKKPPMLTGRKINVGHYNKIRLIFGEDKRIVTFKILAEMLGAKPKDVYDKWERRGRPSKIKNLEFFSREYAVQRTKRIKRTTENLLRYMEATRKEKPKKEVKAKPVKKKRAEGNAEWQALSDDPR